MFVIVFIVIFMVIVISTVPIFVSFSVQDIFVLDKVHYIEPSKSRDILTTFFTVTSPLKFRL